MRPSYVYILTNKPKGVLYIGVTTDIEKRLWQHKNKMVKGFSSQYNLDKLVFLEESPSVLEAIAREKQLKNWHRDWKINLIEEQNPEWKDLSDVQVERDPETSSG